MENNPEITHRILLVEDEIGFRQIHTDLLEAKGFEVFEAQTSLDALAQAKAQLPDLVLLDLILPGLNGLDVLKELRETAETKDVPVVVFSVIGNEEAVEKAKALGASDYLVKGSDSPEELIRRIRKLLKKASAHEAESE